MPFQIQYLATDKFLSCFLEYYNISIMGNIASCSWCEEQKKNQQQQPSITPKYSNKHKTINQPMKEARTTKQQAAPAQIQKISLDSPTRNDKKNARGPENYQSSKFLGKGFFGCVVLVEQKQTGKRYAMKIIQKSKIKEFNVLQCQRIKQFGHQQFLVSIKETFQNQTKIYIIMEYMPMGDMFFYLKKKEIIFSQPNIRDILAEIVVGIGIVHKFGLIYRQLKPENLLVTDEGHIKLTDYGFSKLIIEDKQFISTFVGTLEYMAPEAIYGQFGQKADIWSLGVLMYELMFKQNPFENQERKLQVIGDFKLTIEKNLIYEKINSKIGYMSANFRDLLLKLLQKNPEKRIELSDIRLHDFFKQVNWKEIENRSNYPPLKEVIDKNDFIKFRDANSEQYLRRQYTKHRAIHDNYELNLYQFRISSSS